MVERSQAEIFEAAVFNLKNLALVLVAAKNVMFVLKGHTACHRHIFAIHIEIVRQLTCSANQSGRVAFN